MLLKALAMVSEIDSCYFETRKFLRLVLILSDWCWVSIEFKMVKKETVYEP